MCSLAEDRATGERAIRESQEIHERMGEKAALSTSDDAVNEAASRDLQAHILASRGKPDATEAMARAAILHADQTDRRVRCTNGGGIS